MPDDYYINHIEFVLIEFAVCSRICQFANKEKVNILSNLQIVRLNC